MSKSCCFAVVLAVICLPVISSLEADAQPTIDETVTCSASRLEEVVTMVKIVASNQQQNAEEVKNEIKDEIKQIKVEITDKVKDGIGDVKTLLMSGSGDTNQTRLEDVVREIKDLKKLIAPTLIELDAGEPSKQALLSALVCEYLVCF